MPDPPEGAVEGSSQMLDWRQHYEQRIAATAFARRVIAVVAAQWGAVETDKGRRNGPSGDLFSGKRLTAVVAMPDSQVGRERDAARP